MEKSILGRYFEAADGTMARCAMPLSFLAGRFADVEAWRAEARAKVRELLSYAPPEVALDVAVHEEYVKDGLVYRHVSYAQPYGPRTEGILMRPEGVKGTLPGFVGLHDHGGFKYYGKEKITAPRNAHECMKGFQERSYGNRAWASELALRGYVVFVPDVFLWGSRKIMPEDIPAWYLQPWQGGLDKPVDSQGHIDAYNGYAFYAEHDIAKIVTEAGVTWPGMTVYDDMRAVDFLLTQPDVDGNNIGCGGLSGGGLRTVLLAAMDERVTCSCCVGFMSTSREFLKCTHSHTWMMYIPGLSALMDFADLYSLHGKKPTMALYDIDDALFTLKGQEDADQRLRAIYAKMGAPDLYRGNFFPGPHKFDVAMQETAFAFFDEHLK